MVAPARLRERPPAQYAELHLHTNFSLLDGASNPSELIKKAQELGYGALAVTDHDNLYGAMAFATTCHEHGIQPIMGMELTVAQFPAAERHHLTLLARNRQGYANLCRLASLAHGHSLSQQRDRDGRRRDPVLDLSDLATHTEGLICLTGCRDSEIVQAIDARRFHAAHEVLHRWVDCFGSDSVYVELMDNSVQGDRIRIGHLVELAHDTGVAIVATGDVHYHDRERHRLQDALVAIRHRTTLDESHQWRRPNSRFELKPIAERLRRFERWPDAIRATVEIAQRCRFDPTKDLGYELPSPPVPPGETADSHLADLCTVSLASKYPLPERVAATERLHEELRLIAKHHLAGFFLIYHEVLQLAEDVAKELRQGSPRANTNLPPGRGRGSSVGSIVCYLIGLSHIDPVRNNLFLGRFLNEEMVDLPDIDLDFPRDIRARLFERVYEHWGRDKAAIVGLFPTYRIRSAIRDLGRALDLPPREIDRLAKLAEGYGSAKDVRTEMERAPQFAPLVNAPRWRHLIDLAHQLAGFPRHLSQHVGGVVIASRPLIDCVPIEPAAWPGRYVCHWDKDSIADARMVKIDFLGLGMLSLVEDCIDLIARHRGDLVDLSRISFADPAVYERIHAGDTIGVFQIESRAQAGMLTRSRPDNLDDLACQVAIVRPGPISGGSMRRYIERREQLRAEPETVISMPHPLLEPILRETLGAVLFQEQVLQIAIAIGGFSPGEAEQLRRALGRRDWEQHHDRYRSQFLDGAAVNGIADDIADGMFTQIAGFAQFGFPKSHATAFALLAYQSAWLREYYTPEFYCALYNQWPMGFYPPHVVTNDAKRHGVGILRPGINTSDVLCTVEDATVRIGLTYVDGVGRTLAQRIVHERHRGGPFHSLHDCLQRTGIPRAPLDNLIQVGAFDDFGLNRRELLWQRGLFGTVGPRTTHSLQLRLALSTEQDEVALDDFTDWQRMSGDYSLLGLSPDSHPLALLRSELDPAVMSAQMLLHRPAGTITEIAGLVVCRQQPGTARGMVFLAVEDETGLMNVTINSQLYERERTTVRTSPLLRIRARIEGHSGAVPMLYALAIAPLHPHQGAPRFDSRSWT